MKKTGKSVKRLVSLLLVTVSLLLPVIPAQALYSDYWSKWNKSYDYDSEMGRYIANIACKQDTKTGNELGYAGAWCAKFVMDCGSVAGTSALKPWEKNGANTWVPYYYNNLLAAGGTEITSFSDARAGDIAFFDMNGHDGIDHVEIVYAVSDGIVYTVGGNTGSRTSVGRVVNKRTIPGSAGTVQSSLTNIVRPKYYSIAGDVNGDGSVTTSDSQVIINAILGKGAQLTAEQTVVADVNHDGVVTTADAQTIINWVLGK